MGEAAARPDLVRVTVDDREVEVAPGSLVWDACERAGVFVPVYCAHKKLEPVAVCRMCLVEVEGMPKLQPACATRVADGMKVRTLTEQVRKFRDSNLEFLLLNHPLDCPVCDRGGECDLQDFTQRFGPGRSRQSIQQKVHFDKAIPLSDKIVLDQERCILCWRCVRYYEEITGEREIVLQQRGVHTVVDTFERQPLRSQFQGNLPEICPVGALTHAQYRFRARPWDLRRTASVCSHCSYGCNLFVDARDDQIARYASSDNEDVEDSWLCDRGRYSFPEYNARERVTAPEAVVTGGRQVVSHREAVARGAGQLLRIISDRGPEAVAVVGSDLMTNEEAFVLQWLARAVIGTPHLDHRLRPTPHLSPADFELSIAGIEECDLILVLGGEPERLSPVLTLRLHKAATKRGRRVVRLEPPYTWTEKERPQMVGVIASELDRDRGATIRDQLRAAGHTAELLTIMERVNSRGCQDMGLLPGWLPGYIPAPNPGMGLAEILESSAAGRIKALLVVNPTAELEASPEFEAALRGVEAAVVVTAHPGAASRGASVLIPGRTIVEKAGTVTNTEGRVQRVRAAVEPGLTFPTDLRTLGELAEALGTDLGVPPMATPVFQTLAAAVPAYRGAEAGMRARWGSRG
ncbi:MAG: 2Fe-2S iron-sulfur cluster-binding protein [Candidatus Dormibacteria bacterium]